MHKQYKYDTYITLNPSCLQSPCVCHIKVFDFRGIPSFWGFNSGVSQVGGVSVRHRTNQTAPLSAFALGWDFPVVCLQSLLHLHLGNRHVEQGRMCPTTSAGFQRSTQLCINKNQLHVSLHISHTWQPWQVSCHTHLVHYLNTQG